MIRFLTPPPGTKENGGVNTMRGAKPVLFTICVIVTIAAAVTAIVVFRKQIAAFFVDLKEKLNEKRFRFNGEYEDYVD